VFSVPVSVRKHDVFLPPARKHFFGRKQPVKRVSDLIGTENIVLLPLKRKAAFVPRTKTVFSAAIFPPRLCLGGKISGRKTPGFRPRIEITKIYNNEKN
jgi:hypothetical protein